MQAYLIALVEWLSEKLIRYYVKYRQVMDNRSRIRQVNRALKEKLLSAKTEEEKDAAIRDLLSRL